jgi:uncharacterized protein (TIGR02598 family)
MKTKLTFVKITAAFSLPEVTMAVGIASMAIVLLLGLVPSGLSSIRAAGVTMGESRIIQQISGEIQGADWGVPSGAGSFPNLTVYDGRTYLFDDQGTPLPSGGNSNFIGFVARVRIGLTAPVILPGGASSPNMVPVTIDIAAVGDPQYSFNNPDFYSTRTVLLTRQF